MCEEDRSYQAFDSSAAAPTGNGGEDDFSVVVGVVVETAVLNLALSALVITLVNGDL